MKFLLCLFRITWKTLWYGFAIAVVLTAALFSIARLALPMLGEYSLTVENYFSRFVDQPIRIQSLDAEWRGWGPSLVLNNVLLLDKQGKNTIVHVSKAHLGLGLWKTITTGQLGFTSADLRGVDVSITRMPDGQITLTGFEMLKSVDTPVADSTFLEWLLQQGRIGMQFRNLLYDDRMGGGRKYLFTDVALSIMNQGERHLIEGWVGIPKQPGQKMTLFVDAEGDLLRSDQWSGRLYVSGNEINIINLVSSLTPLARTYTVGATDFEIWSTWRQARLQHMQGRFALQDLAVTPIEDVAATETNTGQNNKPNIINYQKLSGRFHWERQTNGWRLQADRLQLKNQNRQWPESHVKIDYWASRGLEPSQPEIGLKAAGNFIRADDVLPLLQLFELRDNATIKQISALRLGFDVRDFELGYAKEPAEEPQLELTADIENLHSVAAQNLPGIQNVGGRLRVSGKAGYFRLNSENVHVDMPHLFRNKLIFNQLQGDVGWVVDDKALFVTGRNLRLREGEFSLEALLDMEVPLANAASTTTVTARQGPYLNLIAQFGNAEGGQAVRYIPAKIMKPELVQWLDRAIVAGHSSSGNLVFHGNVRQFPFRKGEGVFKVKFDVERGALNYTKDWPMLEDLSAQVQFNGPSLTITSDSGRILHSKTSKTVVRVDDLDKKPLTINIKGEVDGATQDKSDYVMQSPLLRRKFGKFFENMQFSGASKLSVDMDLYVAGGETDANINGSLLLNKNAIRYSWFGEALTAITGTIDIVPFGIRAKAIQADFYGQPTTIDIDTTVNKRTLDSEFIQISAGSEFDSADLSRRYLPAMSDLVSGKSRWNAVVFIPLEDEPSVISQAIEPIRFTAQSNLKRMDLRLPAPFNKPADRAMPTLIEGMLYMDKNYVIRLNYGGRINGVMEYSEADTGVWRGEFRFGSGEVELPNGEGFRFVGHVQDVAGDVWRTLFHQINGEGEANIRGKKTVQWSKFMHSADLTIDRLQLFGQEAKNMMLRASRQANSMVLNVNSDELKGEIRVPYDLDRYPLEMNLDRWELTSSGESAPEDVDPRELPAIKAFAKSVSFKDRKLGSVKLETTKVVEGLRLEQLIMKPRSTVILGTGKWIKIGAEQKSNFDLHVESVNLGETMDDLDYVGSINGGEGSVNINVSWPGALTNVDLARLQGSVSIDFQKGKLLAIDSGAGRIFGLFSLQTLPKRLMLDFSDLYQKGIVFNKISGDFRIEDGDAYTDNFFMDGPAAKAQAAGRIGLANQDYDQLLTFIPQTADIASLIGLVISAPWGFVIPQIFKEDINRAMSFQYTLTGRWDDPQLNPVAKPEVGVFGEE